MVELASQALVDCLASNVRVTCRIGPQWSYDPGEAVVLVPRGAFERGLAAARAGVAHELAHAEVSRFHEHLEPGDALWHVVGALEEGRVDAWALRRWQGAERWLSAARRLASWEPVGRTPMELFVSQIVAEAAGRRAHSGSCLPGAVACALSETRRARRAYNRCLPRTTDEDEVHAAARAAIRIVETRVMPVVERLVGSGRRCRAA